MGWMCRGERYAVDGEDGMSDVLRGWYEEMLFFLTIGVVGDVRAFGGMRVAGCVGGGGAVRCWRRGACVFEWRCLARGDGLCAGGEV